MEPVSSPPVGEEFCIPHKAIVREAAESTKLPFVCDASARESEKSPSLNECLEAGPPLQNRLLAVLVRVRFQPVALTGDMKQAFLQVRIREVDRDALRFHWIRDLETRRVEVLRFTRALIGLAPSPLLFGRSNQAALRGMPSHLSETDPRNRKRLYVDDLVRGGPTVYAAQKTKEGAIDVFGQASFKLHNWHSNVPELGSASELSSGETTFAKEQLRTPQGG